MSSDASIPTDLDACQRALTEAYSQLAELTAIAEELGQKNAKLAADVEELKRYIFGRRSERFIESPGQQHLAFGLADENDGNTPSMIFEPKVEEITYQRRRSGGWNKIPDNIPRTEVLNDVPEAERICPECGEPLVKIGEDRSERLDIIPARVLVQLIVTPKYACAKSHSPVVQAPAPPALVEGGRYSFGFAAQVLTSKFADHLPLYREQDIVARAGLELSRSTFCGIVKDAGQWLQLLAALMKQRLLMLSWLGADDTPVRLLDPTHPDGIRTARFWLYHGSGAAPYDVFDFHESRSRDGPATFLQGFEGWVKVDAYGVNDGVYVNNAKIVASCCWAHVRRKFEAARFTYPSLAATALGTIQRLYDIEDRARELSPDERRALRQLESAPLLEKLRDWMQQLLTSGQVLPKSNLGEAIGYTLNQWKSLVTYLDDGRLPIDNNDTEGELRRITIGRKAWLFIGSREAGVRAAAIYTVVASAARNDLDVWAYLRDVLEKLATAGRAGAVDAKLLESLLPDVWAKTHPDAIRSYRKRERELKATAKRERRKRRRELARRQGK